MRDISVKVTADAKSDTITSKGDRLILTVQAPAESGQANARVIEMVAEYWGIPTKNAMIVRGHTSPSKIVRVYL